MPPISMLIKPASSLCNMKCKYCFYQDVSRNRKNPSYGLMEDTTLENLLVKAFDYAEDFASFAFQGGEPTLAGISFYQKVVDLQRKYNTRNIAVYNSIQTNGYNLNQEWAEFFAKNNFLVGISLDGTSDLHNSMRVDQNNSATYNRVIKSINQLQEYKVDFNILCVVTDYVARHAKKVYNGLKKYKYIQFIPCIDDYSGMKQPYSLTSERYANFLQVTFKEYYHDFISGNYTSVRNFDGYINILQGRSPNNCGMNGTCACSFVIEGDGSTYPCDFYVLDEWRLGNINQDTFEQMKNDAIAKLFIAMSSDKSSNCTQCEFYFLCRAGCRRDREPMAEANQNGNRFCESYLQFFRYSYHDMLDMVNRIQFQN